MVYLFLTEKANVTEFGTERNITTRYLVSCLYFEGDKKIWRFVINKDLCTYDEAYDAACNLATGVRLTNNQACIGTLIDDEEEELLSEENIRECNTYKDFLKYLHKKGFLVENELEKL